MPSTLGRSLESVINSIDLSSIAELPDNIPINPEAFYTDFGYLTHPRTRAPVAALAPYQLEVWKALFEFKRVFCVKSNKIGLSTSTLLSDFHLACLPSTHPLSTRGMDQLIIAQTIQHSKEHLHTLRKLILNSPKYRPFLISTPDEVTLRDEVTKVSTIYIKNPENVAQPSRIIGLGLNNPGAILSWKNVKHIHISDATAAEGDITEGINAAFTRLANTDGSLVIETVPSGPTGRIFDLYQQYQGRTWKPGDFKVIEITADQAVKAGVILEQFLEQEKGRLGVQFARYYMAQFVAGSGNIFDQFMLDKAVEDYPLKMQNGIKVLAVDPGFGSSKFALVGIELVNGILYVREAKQFDRPHSSAMLELISATYHREGYKSCYADSSRPEIIDELRKGDSTRKPVRSDPIVFRESLGDMMMNAVSVVREGRLRLHPTFNELLYQLKAAQYDQDGKPDKKRLSLDLFDAFIMAAYKAINKPITAVLIKRKPGYY